MELFVQEVLDVVTPHVPAGCSEEHVMAALRTWWYLSDKKLGFYKLQANIPKDVAVKSGASLWRSITMDVVNKHASGHKSPGNKTAIKKAKCRRFLEAKTWVSGIIVGCAVPILNARRYAHCDCNTYAACIRAMHSWPDVSTGAHY